MGDIPRPDLTKGDQIVSVKLRECPPAGPFLDGEFLIPVEKPKKRFERVYESERDDKKKERKIKREN